MEQGINFYTAESRAVIERAVQRTIERGEPFDLELDIITAKGTLRTVHTIGKSDPARRKICGFFQDVTERKQSESALRQSEARRQAEMKAALETQQQARRQAEAMSVALTEQLDELRRWQRATLGREGRVLEMKKEINDLLAEHGLPPRYPSAVAEESET